MTVKKTNPTSTGTRSSSTKQKTAPKEASPLLAPEEVVKSSTSPKTKEPSYRPLKIEKDAVTGFSHLVWEDSGEYYGTYTGAAKARAALRAYQVSFGVIPSTAPTRLG